MLITLRESVQFWPSPFGITYKQEKTREKVPKSRQNKPAGLEKKLLDVLDNLDNLDQ